jgi:hypothetical protein
MMTATYAWWPRGPEGMPLELEPEDGHSLVDALMTTGGFTVEEAATIESHVDDRS